MKSFNIVLICSSQSSPFEEAVKPVTQNKDLEPPFIPLSFSQGKFKLLGNLADSIFRIYLEFHSYHLHCFLTQTTIIFYLGYLK